MSDRLALRIGSVSAIVGGVLVLIGNIMHPRNPDALNDVEVLLAEATEGVWVVSHFLILVALVPLLGAFYGLARSIKSDVGHEWARLGWGVALVSVALGLVLVLIDGFAMADLAEEWAASSGAQQQAALAAANAVVALGFAFFTGLMLFLFGAVPVLYGLAILKSNEYASWLGWVAILAGVLSAVVGVIQLFSGPGTLTAFVLFPIASIVITLWIIYLGVLMARQASAVTTA